MFLFCADLTDETAREFVFATAASRAFFSHVQDTIASIQYHQPNRRIYVYDLGLSEQQLLQVRATLIVIDVFILHKDEKGRGKRQAGSSSHKRVHKKKREVAKTQSKVPQIIHREHKSKCAVVLGSYSRLILICFVS